MFLRILRFLVVLAVALFALRALAHELACEKDVGMVQLDASGHVVVDANGLPDFTLPPGGALVIDQYPVTIGWHLRVRNLADDTSIVATVADGLLSAGSSVFGTLPAPGLGIPAGGSIEAIVTQRIGSFEECAGLAQVLQEGGMGMEGALTCGGDHVRENVVLLTTDSDNASCRARIECRPPQLPASCRTVSGIDWCFNPQVCGTGCAAVCASLGMELAISDADWLAAQNTQAKCDAIATAFGSNTPTLGAFTNACLEAILPATSTGSPLNIGCSTDPGCPTRHRLVSDGSPTCSDHFGGICPCSPVFPASAPR